MSVTFVTCLFHIYDINYDINRNITWRVERFKELLETGINICLYVCPVVYPLVQHLEETYENLKIMEIMEMSDLLIYKELNKHEYTLPSSRDPRKDTDEYMILMNSKTEFLNRAIVTNPWNTRHFAWVDFNLTHIFNDKTVTLNFIRDLGSHSWNNTCFHIPGCWNLRVNTDITDSICWRFCGGFLIGDKDSIQDFHSLCMREFPVFMKTHSKLVWEVNLWAWLESVCGWKPTFYQADHDDSIVTAISPSKYCSFLNKLGSTSMTIDYPYIGDYYPGSASYLFYGGKHLLNTRYVSYWICDNGNYAYPDGTSVIKTKNIYTRLESDSSGSLLPVEHYEMDETIKLPKYDLYSQGLEDIRLYENLGCVKYIATTVGYHNTNGNRMIIGDYNYDTSNYSNSQIIDPPTNTICEKNWTPVRDPDGLGREMFIYKWYPMEIGMIFREPGRNPQLRIVKTYKETTHIHEFRDMKGSTPFIENGKNELIGVVHFSKDTRPRSYFHMMVVLEKDTLKPLRYSSPFVFEKVGIEFCIGFRIHNGSYELWISRMDREPMCVKISRSILKITNLFLSG